MGTGHLSIDLTAIAENWRALDALSGMTTQTAAVVKADAYGLGVGRVARVLAGAGARQFFVAVAEEGAVLRAALGPGPMIGVFSGHMAGDAEMLRDAELTPILNSPEQVTRHFAALPGHAFGMQLDSGMNRLGLEPDEWAAVRADVLARDPALVMSHLSCADEPDHLQNDTHLAAFLEMTEGVEAPRSLAATGGTLLGSAYHFDMTRPGIGLYGGLPFEGARPVVRLSLPVIQTRMLGQGEIVGYGASWSTPTGAKIATVSGGYADGLIRHLSNATQLYHGDIPCPLAGRVSMDLLTVDVSHLERVPDHLDILGPFQGVDALADDGGTIGYEILTSLGPRYHRTYTEHAA
ncbi:MAG: alanine racemase [Pseudomonadota bacterium]